MSKLESVKGVRCPRCDLVISISERGDRLVGRFSEGEVPSSLPVDGEWSGIVSDLAPLRDSIASVVMTLKRQAPLTDRLRGLLAYLDAAGASLDGAQEFARDYVPLGQAVDAHDSVSDQMLDGASEAEVAAGHLNDVFEVVGAIDVEEDGAASRGLTLREYRLVMAISELVLLEDPWYASKFEYVDTERSVRWADGRKPIDLVSKKVFPAQEREATIRNTWYLEADMRIDKVADALTTLFKNAKLPTVDEHAEERERKYSAEFEAMIARGFSERDETMKSFYDEHPATEIEAENWPCSWSVCEETATRTHCREGEFAYTCTFDPCCTWRCEISRKAFVARWTPTTGPRAGAEHTVHALFYSNVNGAKTREDALDAAREGAVRAGWLRGAHYPVCSYHDEPGDPFGRPNR